MNRSVVAETPSNVQQLKLTPESLMSFISGTSTNIGRGTFYNLPAEQQQALVDQHEVVFKSLRPFYALMALPNGVNDVNKQLITYTLARNTIRETGLKDNEHSPQTKWENEVILQCLMNMQPNRVMDIFVKLGEKKINSKRTHYFIHEWLKRNKNKWSLWAIKYRKDFTRVLRHIYQLKLSKDKNLLNIWKYLKEGNTKGCDQIIKDYEEVRAGNKNKLAKLPSSVAEGFMTKFGMTKEAFWDLFTKKGGTFTAKEKITKATSVAKAGAKTGFDMNKAQLFDLLVYLKSLDSLPRKESLLRELLEKKGKDIAAKLTFKLEKVALIIDNSKSMIGTKTGQYHPLLKATAMSYVIRHISDEFKEYRTNGGEELIPTVGDQSNYADCVMQALVDGYETIILVGDGYENAPFEGALHELVWTVKKKMDKKDKFLFIHFNPVFASESLDVRAISNLIPQIGLRGMEGLDESMFLVIAKQKPMIAMKRYMQYLIGLQNSRAKELMPADVKKLANPRTKLLDNKIGG